MEKKELTIEQKLNAMRKKVLHVENIWIICCALSLLGTFFYLFLIYKKGILPGTPLRYILIPVCLLVVVFCIYMLPILLRKNRRYAEYSEEYKKAYVKPYMEKAFGEGSYLGNEKVSLREIADFYILEKAKTAKANDCIRGSHRNVQFIRYDLMLGYESKNSDINCVLIAIEMETGLRNEVQLIHEDFKFSGKEYEQPEGYAKILSGRKSFDKEFAVYVKDQKEGEAFIGKISGKEISKKAKSFPPALFLDQNKVYLLIRRDKDVMEAPIYHRVKEGKCIKEVELEVDLIRSWINLLKDCIGNK